MALGLHSKFALAHPHKLFEYYQQHHGRRFGWCGEQLPAYAILVWEFPPSVRI